MEIMEIKNGILYFDGCNTVDLAKEYGTPLYLLSQSKVTAKCQELRECFLDKYDNTRAAYAGKAFLTLSMCKLIEREGLCLDVVSGGELYTAMKANFPAERIEFNGNNKLPEEIEMAVDYGIGRFIIDGPKELPLIEKICKEKNKKVNVLYRINPGVDPHTHSFISTGNVDSKFGFSLEDDTILPAVDSAIHSEYVYFKGLHFHIGSQIVDNTSHLLALDATLNLAKVIKEKYDFLIDELNVGGGFAVKYIESDDIKPYSYYLEPMMKKIEMFFAKMNMPRPTVVIEPGRSIIGEAGATLYTIGSMKDIKGVRKYISVDGGMTDNIRPSLYGAKYEGIVANKADKPKDEMVTICGKCCESGDILIRDINIAFPETGDLFAVYATGAYGYSMANNYNKNSIPAMVLLKDGKSQLIVKRQTYDDLIRNELILSEQEN